MRHTQDHIELSEQQIFFRPGRKIMRILLGSGIAGLALSLVAYIVDDHHAVQAYLVAFAFWCTLALGGLFFILLHHLTGAVWSLVFRRGGEALLSWFPWLFIFSLPVLFGVGELYHWMHADPGDHILAAKASYLDRTFFGIRGLGYFIVWIALSFFLNRTSDQQENEKSDDRGHAFKWISAPGMVLFALTITFAAFDWLMSVDPHWYSTIFGVYVFSGSFLAFIAFLILFYSALLKSQVLEGVVNGEHFHDLGRLAFAFTVFWAYIAGSQYFLIWYANIPEETIWFQHRWHGSWKVVSLMLIFLHFLVPFIILVFHRSKTMPRVLIAVAALLVLMHYVDMYWLVMPAFSSAGARFGWEHLVTLAGLGGVLLWLLLRRLASRSLLPLGDPRLADSILRRL